MNVTSSDLPGLRGTSYLGKKSKFEAPQRGCGLSSDLSKPIPDEHSYAFNIIH